MHIKLLQETLNTTDYVWGKDVLFLCAKHHVLDMGVRCLCAKHHALKPYGIFPTSAPVRGQLSSLNSDLFIAKENVSGTHCAGEWVDQSASA
jgi:hypothetical protein